jgi:hypothetical protein
VVSESTMMIAPARCGANDKTRREKSGGLHAGRLNEQTPRRTIGTHVNQ